MEVRSYNSELGTSNLLFRRLFSNIRIEKVDAKGNKKEVVVNCQLGQRSRILKSWQNADRKAVMKLPMIVIDRTGYSRDSSRVNNLHNEVKYEVTSKNRIYDYLTPVPINISYEVTVMSKYQKDIDQIASNFMVFFNSSLYVSCVHPKFDGIKMNNQVIMEDSVTEDHPNEIDGSQDDLITSTFNFTFKTFLFGGMKQAKKITPMILSTWVSTYVDTKVFEFENDDAVRSYLSSAGHKKLSSVITSQITAEVTSYVPNPQISDYVYDDFAPIINQIDIGFYPVPYVSSITDYMKSVDSYNDEVVNIQGYISSSGYISSYVDGDRTKGISSVIPIDMLYDNVDTSGSIYPYVDRLIWRIDAASPNVFPDNVYVYRKNSGDYSQ